jgi:hypothetical protein
MFSSDEALARVIEETGLDDFGSTSFREGLDRLLEALAVEARLSAVGQAMAERSVVGALTNRLRVEAWWSEHPELDDERVVAPVVIVGMSRSGTTALSHLLGKDPSLRSLRMWEATSSVPPPEGSGDDDPRYLAAVEADAASELVFPGLRAMHHDPPDAPVECNSLFAHEFNSTTFSTVFFVPSFFRWTLDADPAPWYAYHERMLKLLQSRCPGRWNLKGPQHGHALDELRSRYPDATLIVTHRDPAVATASTASLIDFFCSTTSESHDSRAVGAVTAEFMQRCADGLVADHRRHGADGMIHVPYPELVADPLGTVRRVYAEMERDLTPEAEAAMADHVAERPQHKFGVHRYEMEDFGLVRGELEDQFEEYRTEFDLSIGG